MSLFFRKSLLFQVLYVGILGLLSFLIDYFFASTPPLRGKGIFLIQGLVAGIFISAVIFILEILSMLLLRTSRTIFEEYEEKKAPQDLFARVGALGFVPIAEEVFFRGYILNVLTPMGTLIALTLHGFINIPFFYAGRRFVLALVFKIIELSLLGYAFLETKSLALCVIASVVCSLLQGFVFVPGLTRLQKFLS